MPDDGVFRISVREHLVLTDAQWQWLEKYKRCSFAPLLEFLKSRNCKPFTFPEHEAITGSKKGYPMCVALNARLRKDGASFLLHALEVFRGGRSPYGFVPHTPAPPKPRPRRPSYLFHPPVFYPF